MSVLNLSKLAGSSPNNPWTMHQNGELLMLGSNQAKMVARTQSLPPPPPSRVPIIFKGLPSSIIPHTQAARAPAPRAENAAPPLPTAGASTGVVRPMRSIRAACNATTASSTSTPVHIHAVMTPPPPVDRNTPPSSAAMCIRRCGAAPTTSRIQTTAQTPAYWQDDPATNTALKADDFSYEMGDTSLPVDIQPPPPVILKKTRNENSDYPLKAFMEFRDEFLVEMLYVEGRGDPIGYKKCAGCAEIAPTFRCAHQLCHGLQLFCKPCIVREHKVLPTHWIEEWQGESFEHCSLQKLGHVIQLGHPPGYNFIRLFQIMNCLGKIAAYDFMRSLELLTNNDGLTPPLNRRHVFRNIVRQYRMMLMMKRAGRGHSASGVHGGSPLPPARITPPVLVLLLPYALLQLSSLGSFSAQCLLIQPS
ncbi:hypothetical protein B0H17DRAFT_1215809 [Mycena rosella]|uniref:CxC2-like cysteine cluster KDZ transposase-associated domain-containing protein n=1 Tax=Mycena rosella TaxID=1033263 RepID=A0AAD7CDW4_MYCRO|nr:hypothetical protein B0H17DRAFT_1215809 [Mycena rosella]